MNRRIIPARLLHRHATLPESGGTHAIDLFDHHSAAAMIGQGFVTGRVAPLAWQRTCKAGFSGRRS